MNSENQVAVLQQILPAQSHGHEPYLQRSRSNSGIDLDRHIGSDQSVGSSADKRKHIPRPKGKQHDAKPPPLSPFQQASTAGESGDLRHSNSHPADEDAHSPAWYSHSQAAPHSRATDAEAAPSPALAAIQNVATSLTTSLALWGTYITDFVADVAGEDTDDASEEEIAASQKQKQAAKEASMVDQGSVSGDIAQPLTRRHSRSSSGRLSRGASLSSLRLDGDWLTSPIKVPASPPIREANPNGKTASDDGESEGDKKDS